MIADALLGLGLAAVFEGLFLALSPGRLLEALAALDALGPDRLRLVGLCVVGAGVGLVWLARG